MRCNRVELLQKLEAVSPGVAKRETIEQSACFVFKDGKCSTFDDEMACTIPCELGFEGAVAAEKLLTLLGKLAEPEVDVFVKDGKVHVKGSGRGMHFNMEAKILLPIDSVEPPTTWVPIGEDFLEAVNLVRECAAIGDAQGFSLSCIHIAQGWVEACDNFQAARYPCATGIRKFALVRAETIRHILSLDMTEQCETRNWLHYRNPAGLVMSCRKFVEDYPDIAAQFEAGKDETPTALPKGLVEAVDKAQHASSENIENNQVKIELRPGKLRISAEGLTCGYWEVKETTYDGAPIAFMIAPKLLAEITKKHNACTLSPGRLRVDGGRFVFVSCLGVVT